MLSAVTVENVEERPLAVVRFRATSETLGKKIREALDESAVYKAIGPGPFGFNTFVYRCDAEGMDVELGVQIDRPFAETESVKRSTTPAGRVARITHTGPYSELGAANDAILAWCQVNNESPSGTSWEIYGHWNDDPAKLETDVLYLLKD